MKSERAEKKNSSWTKTQLVDISVSHSNLLFARTHIAWAGNTSISSFVIWFGGVVVVGFIVCVWRGDLLSWPSSYSPVPAARDSVECRPTHCSSFLLLVLCCVGTVRYPVAQLRAQIGGKYRTFELFSNARSAFRSCPILVCALWKYRRSTPYRYLSSRVEAHTAASPAHITSKMRPSAVLDERASSAGEGNQNAGGGGSSARVKPETDLSSPLFSASQYLAVTHGVRAPCGLFL